MADLHFPLTQLLCYTPTEGSGGNLQTIYSSALACHCLLATISIYNRSNNITFGIIVLWITHISYCFSSNFTLIKNDKC